MMPVTLVCTTTMTATAAAAAAAAATTTTTTTTTSFISVFLIVLTKVTAMASTVGSFSTGLEAGDNGGDGQPSLGRDGRRAIAYKTCREPGCRRQFVKSRHRHCCSLCTRGAHTSKCDKLQAALQRGKVSSCATHGCWRWASHGHLYCCSDCKHGQGRFHSHACFDRQEWAVATLATSSTNATAASSTGPAPSGFNFEEAEQQTDQADRETSSSKDVEVIDLEAMD